MMGPRYIAGYAVTIAAGFFAPNIWIYHAVLIGAFLATTADREDAICRYVVMIGLVPAVATVALFGSFYAGTFQGVTPLTIAMLIASVVKPVRDRTRLSLGVRAEDVAVLVIFLIFTVGTTRISPFTPMLRQAFVSSFDFLIPYWLLRRNVRSAETLRLMIGCIAISAASLAVIAIYEAKMSWPLFDAIQSRLSMVYGMSDVHFALRGNSLSGPRHPSPRRFFLPTS